MNESSKVMTANSVDMVLLNSNNIFHNNNNNNNRRKKKKKKITETKIPNNDDDISPPTRIIIDNEIDNINLNESPNGSHNYQRKRKRKLIMKLISESFTNSLTQAIIKLMATPHIILKIYLFLNVFAAMGVASYMVLQSIMSYLNYEVITTSRTVYEKPTTFPKILICNQNMFQTEYAYEFINEHSKLQMNVSFDDIMAIENFTLKWDLINRLNFVVNSIANDRQAFSNENRRRLAHDLKHVLIYCSFGPEPCGPDDFSWSFDPVHGNCYSFNSGINSNGEQVGLKKATLAGSSYGLKLMMYVNVYQKLTLFNANWGSMGAILRISNNSYLSDTPDGIKVSPGFDTSISIDRSFKLMLPRPYSNCDIDNESPTHILNSDLYKLIYNSIYQYTQNLCLIQCYQRQLLLECNCTDSNFLCLYSNQSLCNTLEEISCMVKIFLHKFNSIEFIQKECQHLCPLECNVTQYSTKMTFTKLFGQFEMATIKESPHLLNDFSIQQEDTDLNVDRARDSFVQMSIFYESLSYTLSTESPKMNWISLLGWIGGNLGLFLGMSVFSLFEIVQVLIEIYYLRQRIYK